MTTTPDSTSTSGLLARAFADGTVATIMFEPVEVDGLRVMVATEPARAPVDGELLRLPVSYAEQVAICREHGWVSPWLELCPAWYKAARRKPRSQGLVGSRADQAAMGTLGFTRRFSRRLDEVLVGDGLAFGPWKVWLLHPGLAARGAVNHGMYGEVMPGVPVQVAGTAHDDEHWDYSQLLQPVERYATEIASGRLVDLLDYLAPRVPAHFLEVYRVAPTSTASPAPTAPEVLPVLDRGDRGEAVRRLQGLLDAQWTPLDVDGAFGPATDAAVRTYQDRQGLAVDGVVGAGTWGALLGHPVKTTPGASSSSMGPAPACRRALQDASDRAPRRSRASDGIMGDAAHQLRPSGHNAGNAVDITHDPAGGFDCAEWADLAVDDPRVLYVIWDRHICSRARRAEGWRPYTGANPHDHHMHVEIDPAQRADVSPWPWAPRAA